jgi:GntR family transcriptional regulator / MocR family aminotransferase
MKSSGGISPVIAVDRRSRTPLHRQIYDAYRANILSSKLNAGQQVPSTRALSAELGISRIPVLEAYSQLLAEGYFEARPGAGTFVSRSLPDEIPCQFGDSRPAEGGSRILSRRAPSADWRMRGPWVHSSGAFSVGQLAFDHFPFQVWSTLVARQARKVSSNSMNYSDALGYPEFRAAIAHYLRTARGVHCDSQQIMIVSGSQQGLDICTHVLTDPGDAVWIEEPGYEPQRRILAMADCRPVPVRVDEEGLNVAAGLKRSPRARAAYVTPSHQFPLGAVMTASRRLQLLDWAHKANAWIVEDDYDSEYRYESMPIPSLQGLDNGSRVIYIGTFSKTVFPSLRLGYMAIPPDLVDRFAAVRSVRDICAPHFFQATLTEFIEQGHYARHVRKTRLLYKERRGTLVEALRRAFESRLQILGADAGMHLVVTLPPGLNDVQISLRAAEAKLWLWPLSTTYAGKSVRQGFILGFGSTSLAGISKGVSRLRDLLVQEKNWR